MADDAMAAVYANIVLRLVLVLGRPPRLKGNSVRIRGCPAAVSENEPHDEHWPPGWEAVGLRNPG